MKWREFNKEAKTFLLIRLLLAGYYTWPFWYGFSTQIISPTEFGYYLFFAYIVSMVAEIPTGAFADKFGRKKSAIIGAVMTSLYGFIVYFGGSFEWFLVSALFSGIGAAFISGSLESLVYESKGMSKPTFKLVMQTETLVWQTGLIVSTASGGLLFSLHPLLPFVAQGVSFIIAAMLMVFMGNQAINNHDTGKDIVLTSKIRAYIYQNTQGFKHLYGKRHLWGLVTFGTLLSTLVWVGIENLNEAAMIVYGFDPSDRGLILASAKVAVLLLLTLVVYRHIKTGKQKLYYLFFIMLLSSTLFSVGNTTAFLAGFLLFNLISSVADNYIRPIIHDHIENKFRATAISAYSFLTSMFVAVSSLFVGLGLENYGALWLQRVFLVIFAIGGAIALKYALPVVDEKV